MTVLMVRYEVHQESVTDLEVWASKMFTMIEEQQPEGIRYALCKLPDGVTHVGFLELDDGVENPLLSIDAAREFQQHLGEWVDGDPPVAQPLTVIGSYGMFA